MFNRRLSRRSSSKLLALVAALSPWVVAADTPPLPDIVVIAPGSAYRQANLVSDIPGLGLIQDPLLVNPWGISMTASGPFWTANNGTASSTLFRGGSAGSPLFKNPGLPSISIPGSLPTGTVSNGTTDFVVTSGSASGPARFLFASITGRITGWNPDVPAAGSTAAQTGASLPGHVYTGLAIGNNGSGNFLYAADFANGKIDVFNKDFVLQAAASFPFADPTIPTTSGNTFHPYNIQAIGGSLYVTYAKVGSSGFDEPGVGNGFVRRFNLNGVRDLTFGINNGALNTPWGITIAPATFGIFGGALLVGNFGEGNPSIHAFNPTTGAFLGTVQNEAGDGIVIDELWALTFGNGGSGGDPNTLYFTAGTAEEDHGLFGSLKPTTASATSLVQFSANEYSIGEGNGSIQVTVTRAGDVSGSATVDYTAYDESQPGHASQKSDYEIATGKLFFAPGESSKTFRVLLVNDLFMEGDETINLILSNPTGTGLGLGSPSTAELNILDNDAVAPTTNPIGETSFFVRQMFADVLNREPETDAFNFLVDRVNNCGSDQTCLDDRRADVAGAMFSALEFGEVGNLVYLANKAAFGGAPLYGQFMRDTHAIDEGIIVGQDDWAVQLEARKIAFLVDFVQRPAFAGLFPATLTPAQFVDALILNSGVAFTSAERQAAIDEFGGAADSSNVAARGRALRRIAQNATFSQAETNRIFVSKSFFALYRRDPDTVGFNFFLNELNTKSQHDVLEEFLNATEYVQRFGAAAPLSVGAAPSPTPANLLNISSRARVQTEENVAIAGFIITGSADKKVIVRGLGPSLQGSGVLDSLADPILELHKPDLSVITNNNWKDTQQAEIQASGLAPSNNLESAIVATLPPGAYTAIERDRTGGSGVGLVEVYDGDTAAASQLSNISTRALVQTFGNVLIGGFISGGNAHTVAVRALGPSLSTAGITNPLVDPTLELHDANGATVIENDDWRAQQLETLVLGLAPANEKESTIVATLPAGSYTAIVAGKNSGTGVGLVEVYAVQ